MRDMRDSGVAWIGEIPTTWELKTIKQLLIERNEKNRNLEVNTILSLSAKDGVTLYDSENHSGNKPREDLSDYKIVRDNDIVVNSMNILSGAVGLSSYTGVVSPVYYIYYPRVNDSIEYLYYIFKSFEFQRSLRGLGNGILIKETEDGGLNTIRMRIPSKKLGMQEFPVCSVEEQIAIVRILNKKVSEVDTLIANVQAQIEKLKAYKQSLITEVVTKGLDPTVPMKDSGVEWIGEIPEHWQLIRFRFIAKVTTGNQDTQNADPDGAYPFYVRSPIVERCNAYTFDGEGILMAGDGAGAGRVFHLVDGKYAVHQRVYRFYDFKYMNPVLLKYYLENLFSTVMDYGSAKTTVPSVRLPMIQDFCVCVPPENEQQEMISVLSYKTEKIDKLIALKEAKIEKLEQYKKSLIYEYVTGKKEVC